MKKITRHEEHKLRNIKLSVEKHQMLSFLEKIIIRLHYLSKYLKSKLLAKAITAYIVTFSIIIYRKGLI